MKKSKRKASKSKEARNSLTLSSGGGAQDVLPALRVSSMRQKMSKAIDLYGENLKLY